MLYFCHYGETEIGGFGITPADDLLLVEDFLTVKQEVSSVSVAFDDEAVADFFEDQVLLDRQPRQFGRIWLHTHPGNSATPSQTDEETFQRVFGNCDWAVMFILAEEGATYARMRLSGGHKGPKAQLMMPVVIDWQQPFAGSDIDNWEIEYLTHIHELPTLLPSRLTNGAWMDDADLELMPVGDEQDRDALLEQMAQYHGFDDVQDFERLFDEGAI